jgi:hypothetical protein
MKEFTQHKKAWELFRDWFLTTHVKLPQVKVNVLEYKFDSLFGHFLKFFSEHGIEILYYKGIKRLHYRITDWEHNDEHGDTPEEAVAKAFEILEEQGVNE